MRSILYFDYAALVVIRTILVSIYIISGVGYYFLQSP